MNDTNNMPWFNYYAKRALKADRLQEFTTTLFDCLIDDSSSLDELAMTTAEKLDIF